MTTTTQGVTVRGMATLMYDGRSYVINEDSVDQVVEFSLRLQPGSGAWLSIGLEDGGQAKLWVGPGTSMALHTEATTGDH
jgi:hypothetical protein